MGVVVIDSGISNIEKYNVVKFKNFVDDNSSNVEDQNGHGTYCAEIISKINPSVELYIMKVLDDYACGKTENVIKALETLCSENISQHVICMSLSSANATYMEEMDMLCQQLTKRNNVIVAAADNNQAVKSIPASFKYVIGVNGIIMHDNGYWFDRNKEIQYIGDVTPAFLEDLVGGYKMFGGNSKIVAELSARLDNQFEGTLSFDKVIKYLQQYCLKSEWDTLEIVNGRKIDESNFLVNKTKRCSDIFYKVEDIVLKYLNITQKEIQSETLHKYMFPDDYYNILKKIENTLNIIIDYKKIQFKEFNSIYSLVERINQIYRKGEKYNDNRSV